MTRAFKHPIIGQEAVTPDGLGRVVSYADRFPEQWVRVCNYITAIEKNWAPGNVKLVKIHYED